METAEVPQGTQIGMFLLIVKHIGNKLLVFVLMFYNDYLFDYRRIFNSDKLAVK